jgi:hypothetical protein
LVCSQRYGDWTFCVFPYYQAREIEIGAFFLDASGIDDDEAEPIFARPENPDSRKGE